MIHGKEEDGIMEMVTTDKESRERKDVEWVTGLETGTTALMQNNKIKKRKQAVEPAFFFNILFLFDKRSYRYSQLRRKASAPFRHPVCMASWFCMMAPTSLLKSKTSGVSNQLLTSISIFPT